MHSLKTQLIKKGNHELQLIFYYFLSNLDLCSPFFSEEVSLDGEDAALDALGVAGCGVDGVAALVVQPAPVLDLGVAADDAQQVVVLCKASYPYMSLHSSFYVKCKVT